MIKNEGIDMIDIRDAYQVLHDKIELTKMLDQQAGIERTAGFTGFVSDRSVDIQCENISPENVCTAIKAFARLGFEFAIDQNIDMQKVLSAFISHIVHVMNEVTGSGKKIDEAMPDENTDI